MMTWMTALFDLTWIEPKAEYRTIINLFMGSLPLPSSFLLLASLFTIIRRLPDHFSC
jgi:hypothetical protein